LPEEGSEAQYLFQLHALRRAKLSGGINNVPAPAAADMGIATCGGTDASAPERKHFGWIRGGSHSRNLEQGGMEVVNGLLAAVEAGLPNHSSGTVASPYPP
jgi:hypothetical protein